MRKFKLIVALGAFALGLGYCSESSSDDDQTALLGALLLSQRSTGTATAATQTVSVTGKLEKDGTAQANVTMETGTSSNTRAISLTTSTTTDSQGNFTIVVNTGTVTFTIKGSDGSTIGTITFVIPNATTTPTATGTGGLSATGLAAQLIEGDTLPVVTCNNDCRIFLTEATFDGNLGGVTGADEKCMADKNRPRNRNSVYKAMIFSGDDRKILFNGTSVTEEKDWVFKANTKYVRIDGSDFATSDANKLFRSSGGVLMRVDVRLPFFTDPEVVNFWTGFSTGSSTPTTLSEQTGGQCRPTSTTSSWTSNSVSVTNTYLGSTRSNRTILTEDQTFSSYTCDVKRYLVCVEQ